MSFDDQSHTHADKASLNGKSGEGHHRAVHELNTQVPKADARFQHSLEEELVARLRAKQGYSQSVSQAQDERQRNAMQMSVRASHKKQIIDFERVVKSVPVTLVAVMLIVFFMGGALILRMLPTNGNTPMGAPNDPDNGAGIPFTLDEENETSTDTEQITPPPTLQATIAPMFPTATPFGLEPPIFWVIGTNVTIPDDVRQVRVFLYPTEQSQIVSTLEAGTEVTIVEQVGDWVNVVVTQSGAQLSRGGWIDGRLLIQSDGETPGIWATPTPAPLEIQAVEATPTLFMPTAVPPSGEVHVITATPIPMDNSDQGRGIPVNPTMIPTMPPVGGQIDPQAVQLIPVLIAAENIEAGDEITEEQVFVALWPAEYVPEGSHQSLEELGWILAPEDVPQYSPILIRTAVICQLRVDPEEGLRVRLEPDIQSEPVTVLESGAVLDVIAQQQSEDGQWYRVRHNVNTFTFEGWVREDSVTVHADSECPELPSTG